MKKKYILIIASIVVIALIVACGQIFTVRNVSVVFYNKTGLADEAGVLKASGLSGHNNIFNVKESDVKSRVANAYPDRSVVVTNIVRNFPDKVTIYVKERVPIFKIPVYSADGEDKFVPTDKDFQRGNIQNGESIDALLVEIKGFLVHETFDVKECVQLRALANALIKKEIEEDALPYFLSEVTFDNGNLNVLIRETNAMFIISADKVAEQTAILYDNYLALDASSRYGAVLRV